MDSELPFSGFHELINVPLATADQRSFAIIRHIFIKEHPIPKKPLSILIKTLTGKELPEQEAKICWKQILKHKTLLQQKLERTVGIQTASIDYFEYLTPVETLFNLPTQLHASASMVDTATERIYAPGYHLEKLKDEMFRSKRYRHALSVIVMQIDNFRQLTTALTHKNADQILSTIVKIILKTVRNVDVLSRISDDRFLLILPDTNSREAKELAERIRINIIKRTRRLNELAEGATATLSVGQCTHEESSIEFLHRIEHLIPAENHSTGNTVFSIL